MNKMAAETVMGLLKMSYNALFGAVHIWIKIQYMVLGYFLEIPAFSG